MKRRKTYIMLVAVTAPRDMPAAAIRREVRSLITHQANWAAEPDDVKAVRAAWPKHEASAGGGRADR